MINRLALWCFATLGITFYCQGIIAALQSASGDVARTVAGETNLSSTITQSLILVILAILVLREPEIYLRLGRYIAPLLCVVAFALLSVVWSANPVRTLRRGFAFAECILFGLFLYRSYGLAKTIERLGWVTVFLGVFSLVVYVAVPRIGHETALGYENAMRGVFPQKNTMADCMLLGVCCFAFRLQRGRRLGMANLLGLSILGVCLLLGRSASSILVAAIVVAVAVWMRLRGRTVLRVGYAFVALWALAALVCAFVLFPQEIFSATGRDATLTGRLPLWAALLPEIHRRLLLGYGYAAFWDADSPMTQYIWLQAGWPAPDAHSGYLDVLLQIGLVGLGLFGWIWLRTLRLLRRTLRFGVPEASWIALYATAFLLTSLDEGPLSNPNAWTMMLPCVMVAMSKFLERRPTADPGRSTASAPLRNRRSFVAGRGSRRRSGLRAGESGSRT